MNQVKKYFHRGENVSTAVAVVIISTAVIIFPPRWKCFHRGDNNYSHRGENVSTAVIIISICACSCGRACVCASGCVRVFMCACVRGCVSACVRACLRARIRMYDYCIILLLWSAVAQWENAGLAIEREVFESPLIPFRSLGIFFLFTMPQFTQLYK